MTRVAHAHIVPLMLIVCSFNASRGDRYVEIHACHLYSVFFLQIFRPQNREEGVGVSVDTVTTMLSSPKWLR